jgi:hypothetical protein
LTSAPAPLLTLDLHTNASQKRASTWHVHLLLISAADIQRMDGGHGSADGDEDADGNGNGEWYVRIKASETIALADHARPERSERQREWVTLRECQRRIRQWSDSCPDEDMSASEVPTDTKCVSPSTRFRSAELTRQWVWYRPCGAWRRPRQEGAQKRGDGIGPQVAGRSQRLGQARREMSPDSKWDA